MILYDLMISIDIFKSHNVSFDLYILIYLVSLVPGATHDPPGRSGDLGTRTMTMMGRVENSDVDLIEG